MSRTDDAAGLTIYVAGPMRGIPDFNFPAFDAAALQLRALGHVVCNPAERDREIHGESVGKSATGDLADIAHLGFDLRETLAWDLNWIAANADAVAVLPGWEDSKGAAAEVALARALGLVVATVASFTGEEEPSPVAIGEVRVTSSTGGQKGVKDERFDLIPAIPLGLLARHYGRGALKYDDHNWRRGYPWGFSYGAMQRHLKAFWAGEDIDEETGSLHVIAAAWHCFTLAEFLTFPEYAQHDDRYLRRE